MAYDPGTAEYGNMLDWLIPQQLRRDIQSQMAPTGEYGMDMYEKLYAEFEENSWKEAKGEGNWDRDDWERRVRAAGFGDMLGNVIIEAPEDADVSLWEMGIASGRGLRDPEDLTDTQISSINQAGIARRDEQMASFNPLSGDEVFSSLSGVGPHYATGVIGAGDPDYTGETGSRSALEQMKMAVQPLSLPGLRKLHTGYYSPYIAQERKPLTAQLAGKRATARGAGGDFSGYGRRGQLEDVATGSFLSKVEDIYSGVDELRAGATQDVMDILTSWEDLSTTYKG